MAKTSHSTTTTTTTDPNHQTVTSAAKTPRQMRAFWSIAKYAVLASSRNKSTLAFGFIFPVVFVAVFGLLGNSTTSVKIGIDEQVSKANPLVKVLEDVEVVAVAYGDEAELKEQVKEGELDAYMSIEQPAGGQGAQYQVELLTSNNPATAGSATALVQGVVDKINLQLAGVQEPPVTVEQSSVGGQHMRYIDFALPGQIGFALLSTAIFGTVFGFISLKRTLVLKRLFATPTKPLTFLTAQGASRLFWALLQTVVIVSFGVLAFDFYLANGWGTFISMLGLSAIGLVAFLGFGYFMAGLANDENSANPLVNLVTLPQFLLSGVFFPTDSFPSWVQPIANNLPLSYFNIAMRNIATDGMSLPSQWPYILGLLAWGGVMYYLASRTFKWE